MRLVIAAVLLLIATCTQAKAGCDVELEGGLRITATALEFTENDQVRYKILNDQTLVVNDRVLNLDSSQQLLVKQYATGIRALVPEIQQLTLDGVDVAAQAMGLVFQEFLGSDNQAAKKIQNEFLLLKSDIEKNFASGKPININQKGLQDNDFLGMDFESRLGNIVDTSGKEIGWSLFKNIGFAIFSNEAFEKRMNKFGERMEHEMNTRAETMERRGNVVCTSVAVLDRKEEALKQLIKEISSFTLIKLKNAP